MSGEKLPVDVPSHLAHAISKAKWNFICAKYEEWKPAAFRACVPNWLISNWLITFACNSSEENYTFTTKQILREEITDPLDVIETFETLRRTK